MLIIEAGTRSCGSTEKFLSCPQGKDSKKGMNFAFDSEVPGGLVEPQRAGGLTESGGAGAQGRGPPWD